MVLGCALQWGGQYCWTMPFVGTNTLQDHGVCSENLDCRPSQNQLSLILQVARSFWKDCLIDSLIHWLWLIDWLIFRGVQISFYFILPLLLSFSRFLLVLAVILPDGVSDFRAPPQARNVKPSRCYWTEDPHPSQPAGGSCSYTGFSLATSAGTKFVEAANNTFVYTTWFWDFNQPRLWTI